MKKNQKVIILGVDPGSNATGYGLIQTNNSKTDLINWGVIRTSAKDCLAKRLKDIYDQLFGIIKAYHPDEFAIEKSFYSRNVNTAMALGQVRGVAMLAAVKANLPISEYSPREIKCSIVGLGGASKTQVGYMVKNLLGQRKINFPEDAADALAVALCRAHKIGYELL